MGFGNVGAASFSGEFRQFVPTVNFARRRRKRLERPCSAPNCPLAHAFPPHPGSSLPPLLSCRRRSGAIAPLPGPFRQLGLARRARAIHRRGSNSRRLSCPSHIDDKIRRDLRRGRPILHESILDAGSGSHPDRSFGGRAYSLPRFVDLGRARRQVPSSLSDGSGQTDGKQAVGHWE
jgi:hypothetical protein